MIRVKEGDLERIVECACIVEHTYLWGSFSFCLWIASEICTFEKENNFFFKDKIHIFAYLCMSHKVGILPQTSLGGLLSAYEQTSSVLKNAGGNILNDDILEEDYEDYDEKERNEIPEEGDEEEKGKNDVRLAEEAAKLGDLTLTELTSSVEVSEGMVELMINKELPTA